MIAPYSEKVQDLLIFFVEENLISDNSIEYSLSPSFGIWGGKGKKPPEPGKGNVTEAVDTAVYPLLS